MCMFGCLDDTKHHLKSIISTFLRRASYPPSMKAAHADNLDSKFKTNQVVYKNRG